MKTKRKNWHSAHRSQLTPSQRIADAVAATMGSWRLIIAQSIVLAVWVLLNVVAWIDHWDPYPFILMNLALSFQAAYAAPFIMISQNRQAERDRHQADEDFRTNVEAEQRIEDLQKHLASIEVNKLNRIIELLESRSGLHLKIGDESHARVADESSRCAWRSGSLAQLQQG